MAHRIAPTINSDRDDMFCNVNRNAGVLSLALLLSGCGTGTQVVSGDTAVCTRTLRGNCVDWLTQDAVTVMLTPEYGLCSVVFENHAGKQVSFEGGTLERYVDTDNWQCRTPAAPGGPERLIRMADALISVGTVSPDATAVEHHAYFLRTDTYYGWLHHFLLAGRPTLVPL